MNTTGPPIVLLYDDDAYVERLTHGTWENLAALVRSPASAASLLRLCREHPSSRGRAVRSGHEAADLLETPGRPCYKEGVGYPAPPEGRPCSA